MIRKTSIISTLEIRIFLAITNNWFIKKIEKKNENETKKANKYSFDIYTYRVVYRCFFFIIFYVPVEPKPPSPRLVLFNLSVRSNSTL